MILLLKILRFLNNIINLLILLNYHTKLKNDPVQTWSDEQTSWPES